MTSRENRTIVRMPAVAGSFYPGEPGALAEMVDALLAEAAAAGAELEADAAPAPDETPGKSVFARAVLAPHAGFIYSGKTAAQAYRALDPKTKRVVVLGPTHYVGIQGMALTGADLHETPLGMIPTDVELTALFERQAGVVTAPLVHSREHSMEVHLPFLQRYLVEDFTVVPVAVGNASPQAVAALIDVAWQFPDVSFVISSDLSHYLPYEVARRLDGATVSQIVRSTPPLIPEQACGATPTSGMMLFAQRHGLKASVLDIRNSGDTAGDKSRVVGYGALAWHEDVHRTAEVDADLGADLGADATVAVLPRVAHAAIAAELGGAGKALTAEPLSGNAATFVTLTLDGKLRGCMGSLVPRRPLKEDVAFNARAAAFRDARFPPLTKEEFERADLAVSLLSATTPMVPADDERGLTEEEVCSRLRSGIDGVVLNLGDQQATFLPHVWEQLPDPTRFLAALKQKAGLPGDYWKCGPGGITIETYTVVTAHLER